MNSVCVCVRAQRGGAVRQMCAPDLCEVCVCIGDESVGMSEKIGRAHV